MKQISLQAQHGESQINRDYETVKFVILGSAGQSRAGQSRAGQGWREVDGMRWVVGVRTKSHGHSPHSPLNE